MEEHKESSKWWKKILKWSAGISLIAGIVTIFSFMSGILSMPDFIKRYSSTK